MLRLKLLPTPPSSPLTPSILLLPLSATNLVDYHTQAQQDEKLALEGCRIYRKKKKLLDNPGRFVLSHGDDPAYTGEAMEEEIQEDLDLLTNTWDEAKALLVKIRAAELDALKH